MLPVQFGSNKRKFRDQNEQQTHHVPHTGHANRVQASQCQSGYNTIYGPGGNHSAQANKGAPQHIHSKHQRNPTTHQSYFNAKMLIDPWMSISSNLENLGLSTTDVPISATVNQRDNTIGDRYFKMSMITDPWSSMSNR